MQVIDRAESSKSIGGACSSTTAAREELGEKHQYFFFPPPPPPLSSRTVGRSVGRTRTNGDSSSREALPLLVCASSPFSLIYSSFSRSLSFLHFLPFIPLLLFYPRSSLLYCCCCCCCCRSQKLIDLPLPSSALYSTLFLFFFSLATQFDSKKEKKKTRHHILFK